MKINIPDIEIKDTAEIKRFQEKLLQKQLKYTFKNSNYYKKLFVNNNIDISTVKTIEDLQRLPFTSKNDLAANNTDFICVPKEKIVDYITTSGTIGDPVVFCMTEKDLQRLAYNEAVSLSYTGCNQNSIIQLTTTIDKRFMAGLAYFLGARKLGAGIVRVGAGMPELQWDTIRRIKPDTLIVVPSFIPKLVDYAIANSIDYKNSSVKRAICIGEPLRKADFSLNTLACKIKESWDIDLYSTYASTEMSTSFTECCEGVGGHHHPELIITEFVDEKGNIVEEGKPGEVVITTLGVEGMPLIRFKTGDICTYYTEPCKCGRNTMRIGPVIGRKQHMIKLKGTTIYPPAIFDLLDDIKEIENYVVELFTNDIGTEDVLVRVGCLDTSRKEFNGDLEKKIKDHFRAKIRVSPSVKIENSEKIELLKFPGNSRKPILFFDKR